jgi:hypothetical protein
MSVAVLIAFYLYNDAQKHPSTAPDRENKSTSAIFPFPVLPSTTAIPGVSIGLRAIPPIEIPLVVSRFGVTTADDFVARAIPRGTPLRGRGRPSGTTAEAKKHAVFVKWGSQPGDPDLLSLYQEINVRHFGGALPPIPVNWEPELSEIGPFIGKGVVLEGMTNGDRIFLNSGLKTDERAARGVLCHEMVHVSLQRAGTGIWTNHGPPFVQELRRLLDEGAFEGLLLSRDEEREMLHAESGRLDAEPAFADDIRVVEFSARVARYRAAGF